MSSKQSVPANQSWFILTCILAAGSIGVFSLNLGSNLANKYGPGTALLGIVLGTIILWLLSLAIVIMSGRNNSIENAVYYFGNIWTKVIATILCLTLISWFGINLFEIAERVEAMIEFPQSIPGWSTILIVGIGLACTVPACFGVNGLKWVCVVSLPVQLICVLYLLLTSIPSPFVFQPITLGGTPVVIATLIAGIFEYPTFTRHHRKKADSLIALILVLIILTAVQAAGIFINLENSSLTNNLDREIVFFLFMASTVIPINVWNVYAASVGFEALAPRIKGGKKYLILCCLGLATALIPNSGPALNVIVEYGDILVSMMLIVLVCGFLAKRITSTPLSSKKKHVYVATWLLGSSGETASRQLPIFDMPDYWGGSICILVILGFALAFREVIWGFHHADLKL